MGVWGDGILDNDDALDLLGRWDDADGSDIVEQDLEEVLALIDAGKSLWSWQCRVLTVGAATVAVRLSCRIPARSFCRGYLPSKDTSEYDEVPDAISDLAAGLTPAQALRMAPKFIRGLQFVRTPMSEVYELAGPDPEGWEQPLLVIEELLRQRIAN